MCFPATTSCLLKPGQCIQKQRESHTLAENTDSSIRIEYGYIHHLEIQTTVSNIYLVKRLVLEKRQQWGAINSKLRRLKSCRDFLVASRLKMSSNIYEFPNLIMNVRYSEGVSEDRGEKVEVPVDIYESADYQVNRSTQDGGT